MRCLLFRALYVGLAVLWSRELECPLVETISWVSSPPEGIWSSRAQALRGGEARASKVEAMGGLASKACSCVALKW